MEEKNESNEKRTKTKNSAKSDNTVIVYLN